MEYSGSGFRPTFWRTHSFQKLDPNLQWFLMDPTVYVVCTLSLVYETFCSTEFRQMCKVKYLSSPECRTQSSQAWRSACFTLIYLIDLEIRSSSNICAVISLSIGSSYTETAIETLRVSIYTCFLGNYLETLAFYFLFLCCGAPSLMRGWVCDLQVRPSRNCKSQTRLLWERESHNNKRKCLKIICGEEKRNWLRVPWSVTRKDWPTDRLS
jgi:hypothetical protein